jgi:hypothetical protein
MNRDQVKLAAKINETGETYAFILSALIGSMGSLPTHSQWSPSDHMN